MAGLLFLPVELILMITSFLGTFKDLSALTRVHPYLLLLLSPRLYHLAISDVRSFLPFYRRPRAIHTLSHLPSEVITRIYGSGYASIVGWAILYGPVTLLRRLVTIPGGISPNAVFHHWWDNVHGVSLLSVAVIHGRREIAEALLEAGAIISEHERLEWTPLRWAVPGTLHVKWNRVDPSEGGVLRLWTTREIEMGRLLVKHNAIGC